ncbi:Alpha-N-acetylglucosaminidase family / NAGLU family isoform 1 [Hibiscus syriacus]|uniref:Alpha-N-acetylglucosaminidase family / NAGLU family isoform 1 n=1 Tax=Hibiscus syriacus TaxID=106335 RepID=A0A6A2Y6G2_HIBSY|nr:Alpha-N-acetylglucosaminidase family / NAGLU family isoform 1 [Hibiscus syriacus]
MERNNSYGHGSSWADQWGTSNAAAPTGATDEKKSGSGGSGATAKYKQKVGDGLEKTKSVASTGMMKVKQGTSSGIQWIKDEYGKTTQKN